MPSQTRAPRRQGSVLVQGAGPTRRATIVAPRNHDPALSALNNAIATIDVVNQLVPLELAKGVLSTISGILGVVKNTIDNQGDFKDLAEQCQKIGLVIWRATSGTPERQVSETIRRALTDLNGAVNYIREGIEEKMQKNLGSQVFHIKINQTVIEGWRKELDRLIVLFNTELNIDANIKLDELLASFEELRSTVHTHVLLPDAIPVRPAIFVGRDDLVRTTIDLLLKVTHVALIGPGGMGKTSIARAVLNDDEISKRFAERRFFVRYDDMDASQITYGTFLDRIAKSLGIASSKVDTHAVISKTLSTSEILLVLDNAETFLDAALDAGKIASAIDDFGARSNVVIMLTTRTTSLPPNLRWERLRVPALEESAAFEAFKMIYRPTIEPSILSKLLAAIDFHPLSINLLAQVGSQNEWSPDELVAAWERQHAILLENGTGKIQSIAVTIEMSLNSPSVTKLGDTVRQLLHAIAFLPQGINKTRFGEIFPATWRDIESCADILCRHSLAYHKDDFITLLAPIRLYVLSQARNTLPSQIPLISQLYMYYEERVTPEEYSEPLIRSEDVNIEHVIASFMEDPTMMEQVLILATRFIQNLADSKPRPVSLRSVVSALRPHDAPKSASCLNLLRPTDVPIMRTKGECLYVIATNLLISGQVKEAEDVSLEARDILRRCGSAGRRTLMRADIVVGLVYSTQGKYKTAEESFRLGLNRRSRRFFLKSSEDREIEALVAVGLADMMVSTGRPGAAKVVLAAANDLEEVEMAVNAYILAGTAELMEGNIPTAKEHIQHALTHYIQRTPPKANKNDHLTLVIVSAEIAHREGRASDARAARDEAQEIIRTHPYPTGELPDAPASSAYIAIHVALEGDITKARELMGALLLKQMNVVNLSIHTVDCLYLAGCLELLGKDLKKAGELFLQALELCHAVSEFLNRARTTRALGEIAVLQNDLTTAKRRFEETLELCNFTGVPPAFLYRTFHCYRLGENLNGWNKFLDGVLSL